MHLSDYALDQFVAPHLSNLTTCGAPDMSQHDKQSDCWVRNFILNTLLRVTVKDPVRQYTFNFLRRAEAAFAEYDRGRQALGEFIDQGRDAISRYLLAVLYFESFLSQVDQARNLLQRIGGNKKLFERDDGSILQRLNTLCNFGKHADQKIASGDVPEGTTMALWLTNDGMECSCAKVTFREMAEVLADLAVCAKKLCDPTAPENDGG